MRVPPIYVKEYIEFLKTPEGIRWKKEREDRIRQFQKVFSKHMLLEEDIEIFEHNLRKILKELWAMTIWADKDKRIDKIISRNGIVELRKRFYQLIYGYDDIQRRLDVFLKNVWGLGISAITEILCFTRPNLYAMWNAKVVKALKKLNLIGQLGLSRTYIENPSYITGKHYKKILLFLSELKHDIEEYIERKIDFVELDYILYYIAEYIEPFTMKAQQTLFIVPTMKIKTHDEAQFYLVELGKMLGYSTYVAKSDRNKIVNGKILGNVVDLNDIPEWLKSYPSSRSPENIDVLWFDSSGESLRYAFEVSHSSDLRVDLSSLMGIIDIVRKAFIVAPEERKEAFIKLLNRRPYSKHRKRLGFISYKELATTYERATKLREILKKLDIEIEG